MAGKKKEKKSSAAKPTSTPSTTTPAKTTTVEWWKRGKGYYYGYDGDDYYDDDYGYGGYYGSYGTSYGKTEHSSSVKSTSGTTTSKTPASSKYPTYSGGYSYGYSSPYSGYHYGGSGYSYGSGGFYDRYRSSLGYSSSSSKLTASIDGTKFANTTELMSKAYKETRDMIVILDFPFDVKVTFSENDGVLASLAGKENVRYIFLETAALDDGTVPDAADKVNIICGNGVHEACHLKYTSKLVSDEFCNFLESKGKLTTVLEEGDDISKVRIENSAFVKVIFNLIEDMRVENNLLVERPGYSDLLSTAKDYGLKKYKDSFNSIKFDNKEVGKFLDNLVKLIRYPDEINESIIEAYSDAYTDIKNVISPLPKSTKDSCRAAVKVFNRVLEQFKDFTATTDAGKKKTRTESKTGGTSTTGTDGAAVDSLLSIFAKSIMKCTSDILSGHDSCEAISSKGTPITGGKLAAALREKMASSFSSEVASLLVTGDVDKGIKANSYFKKETGRERVYKDCLSRVNKYIPSIRKLIKGVDKNYDFNIYGCRSGLLDTTKLAEAYQGVPQVYVRKGEVRTNKLSVGILIDESGSMGTNREFEPGRSGHGEDLEYAYTWCRSFVARDAAILLNEALKPLPGVDLYVYGHSADITCCGSTELYVYRESTRYAPKYSLSEVNGRYENRDGTAIIEAATRIRKFTNEPGILFILSDGSPCAHGYWGGSAEEDVRKNVEKAESMGFTVIQISIGHVPNASRMFKNVVDLTSDMSQLPIALSKVVKKAIVDNKKTTIK